MRIYHESHAGFGLFWARSGDLSPLREPQLGTAHNALVNTSASGLIHEFSLITHVFILLWTTVLVCMELMSVHMHIHTEGSLIPPYVELTHDL